MAHILITSTCHSQISNMQLGQYRSRSGHGVNGSFIEWVRAVRNRSILSAHNILVMFPTVPGVALLLHILLESISCSVFQISLQK